MNLLAWSRSALWSIDRGDRGDRQRTGLASRFGVSGRTLLEIARLRTVSAATNPIKLARFRSMLRHGRQPPPISVVRSVGRFYVVRDDRARPDAGRLQYASGLY